MHTTSDISSQAKFSQLKINKFIQAKFLLGPHKIPLKRQRNNQFFSLFSIKAGMRIVRLESLLEENIFIWAESNPLITHICEQPLRIYDFLDNSPYVTLDVSFKYKDGREVFYEIKPVAKLKQRSDGSYAPQNWDLIDAWCKNNGFYCDFISEEKIQNIRLLANWRRIIALARMAYEVPEPLLEADLLNLCKQYRSISINEIYKNFNQSEDIINAVIAKIIHQGLVEANLDNTNLSKKTVLRYPDHA